MEAQLTAQALLTLGGVILFQELILNLIVKRALRKHQDSPDYGLMINIAAILLGVAGSAIGQYALRLPFTGPDLATMFLRAVEAAGMGTGGREALKNIRASYNSRNGGGGL